jgi:digeranylgeranylglycerophospholipid reductase
MDTVDVAIVGAGMAGCLAARDIARAGFSVALIERQPREKLGHNWWDTIRPEVFDEVGMARPEPPELMCPGGQVTVYPPLDRLALKVDDGGVKIRVDRKPLAQRLLSGAEQAGARVIDKALSLGPIVDNGSVCGLMYRVSGKKEELRARLTLDCSGIVAALRKGLPDNEGFTRYLKRDSMFVTHREIRENTSGAIDSTIYFGTHKGVRWIKKEQEGLIDFFAGYINLPGRPSPRAAIDEMVRATAGTGKMIRGGYGAPIPVRHCFDSFVQPGFMLIGDSACQCNPIDGSGMASSLRAAKHAASTARAALENNSVGVEALWPYNAAYKRTQGADFVLLDALQKFLVGENDANIEMLFRRQVIKATDFWGTGKAKKKSAMENIATLLRIIDKPAFLVRLVRATDTGKKLSEHFRNFPESPDPKEFEAWKLEKLALFHRIESMYR